LLFRAIHILNKTVEVTDDPENGLSLKKPMDLGPEFALNKSKHAQSLPIQVQLAAVESLENWYHFIQDKMPLETSRLLKLKNITEMVNYLTIDLQQSSSITSRLFQDSLGLDYLKLAYEIYEKQLTEAARELVETTCDKLKPVIYESNNNDYVEDTIAIGTALFEAYLNLQVVF
jgi:hypothetical protein